MVELPFKKNVFQVWTVRAVRENICNFTKAFGVVFFIFPGTKQIRDRVSVCCKKLNGIKKVNFGLRLKNFWFKIS
jgi:hypothetical protein